MKLYTVGCYECGEFHAYESENQAEQKLTKLNRSSCNGEGTHELGIVLMSSDRIPMWG